MQCDLYTWIWCCLPSPYLEPLARYDDITVLWNSYFFITDCVCRNNGIRWILKKKLQEVQNSRSLWLTVLVTTLKYLTAFQTHVSDDSFLSKLEISWWISNRVRSYCISEMRCFSSAYLWHPVLMLHLLFTPAESWTDVSTPTLKYPSPSMPVVHVTLFWPLH